MTTKELIKAEIDNVEDGYLDELYSVIKSFVEAKTAPQEGSFMSRLRCIKINVPGDFSVNKEDILSYCGSWEDINIDEFISDIAKRRSNAFRSRRNNETVSH